MLEQIVGEVGRNVAILNLAPCIQSGMDIKNKGGLLQGIT